MKFMFTLGIEPDMSSMFSPEWVILEKLKEPL